MLPTTTDALKAKYKVYVEWCAVCKYCGRVFTDKAVAAESICARAGQLDYITDELEKAHEPLG